MQLTDFRQVPSFLPKNKFQSRLNKKSSRLVNGKLIVASHFKAYQLTRGTLRVYSGALFILNRCAVIRRNFRKTWENRKEKIFFRNPLKL